MFPHMVILLQLIVGPVLAAELKTITAELGQNVVLPCLAPDDKPILAVKWNRTDLEKDVCFYRDDQIDPDNQHPSFQNRVDLEDGEMKVGNVSLILRDVRSNDTDTYECYIFQKGADNRERASAPICSLHLNVTSSGPKQDDEKKDGGSNNGSAGLAAGLIVFIIVGGFGFLI